VIDFDPFILREDDSIAAAAVTAGLIGVLLADTSQPKKSGLFGIQLQNATMKMLQKEFLEIEAQFKVVDLMDGVTIEEFTQRNKRNRRSGFAFYSVEQGKVDSFLKKNPDVNFGIHIASFFTDSYNRLKLETHWTVYDKNSSAVVLVESISVAEELIEENFPDDVYTNAAIKLQYKNLSKFIRLAGFKMQ